MSIHAISFASSSAAPERTFWDKDGVEKLTLGSSKFGEDTAIFETEYQAKEEFQKLYKKYAKYEAAEAIERLNPMLVTIYEKPLKIAPSAYSE